MGKIGILVGALVVFFAEAWAHRPNMVWIFSDDHSCEAIGAYSGRFQELYASPHIDLLASQGMRFDHAYITSIGTAGGAPLFTGKPSPTNVEREHLKSNPFDHDQQQFHKILQTNGYQTVMIGRVCLDEKLQGFDYWEVLAGEGSYYDPVFITEKGKTVYKGKYVTDVITERTLNWLRKSRDEEKPFMLMVHHKAPRRNVDPADRHMILFKDIKVPEPDHLFADNSIQGKATQGQAHDVVSNMQLDKDLKVEGTAYANTPRYAERRAWFAEHKPEGKELVRWKYQTYMKDYLRCAWGVDESVGRIIRELKKLGLTEDTIVMYSSEQSFYMGAHGWFDEQLINGKSLRAPLIVRWPGEIKPGSVNTNLVHNMDFAKTFLDLGDAPIPDDMQGKSLVPLLKGATSNEWRNSLYYHDDKDPTEPPPPKKI